MIETVSLKDIICSKEFENSKTLTMALGKDIQEIWLCRSLETHLLAGTTGSGKLVGTYVISLLYKHDVDHLIF